jgi:DNA polymerase III subunit beta
MATIQIQRSTIKAASHFMAQKDIRYYLNGILIESSPVETRACATDGHAMLLRQEDRKDDNAGSARIILPADTVAMILKWKAPFKSAADMPVTITVPDDPKAEHRAEWCGQIAVFRPVEGNFPDYQRVIPQSLSGEAAHFNPELLMRCQKAAVDLGTSKAGYFAFTQNGGSAAVATFSPQAFAIVMPMRGEKADAADTSWARNPVAAPAPTLQAVA